MCSLWSSICHLLVMQSCAHAQVKLSKTERARAEVRRELRNLRNTSAREKVAGVARTAKHTKVAVYFMWLQQFVRIKGK